MKIALTGAVGLVVVLLLCAHFGMQLYVNYLIQQKKDVSSTSVQNMNYYNIVGNAVAVLVLLAALAMWAKAQAGM